MDLISIIRQAAEAGASDIHIIESNPPLLRIKGEIQPLENYQPITSADIEKAFTQISTEAQRAEFQQRLELDFGYSIQDVGRIRCNVARQRGSTSMAIRLLPAQIPPMEELGLPEVCKELILKPRGLVVVSGTTGSGKSTTLSAMINYLNKMESRRLITIEDPIEFIYTNNKCTITQRELGGDTRSFAEALRHALRQDPDVLMVGEMRDLETASAVLTIAETGHLVLTTGHAPSAPQTIERIIDMFPPYERDMVQARLASLIVGVMTQVLVPTQDRSGRVPAVEVMMASPAIRSNIREGKMYQIPNAMVTQARLGNILLDTALINLYRKGKISAASVLAHCNEPDEVNKQLGTPNL